MQKTNGFIFSIIQNEHCNYEFYLKNQKENKNIKSFAITLVP